MAGRGDFVPDYKEMYFKLFRASEQTINLLIQAQQECEELYMSQENPPLSLLPSSRLEPGQGEGNINR